MTRYFAAYADSPEEYEGRNLNVGATYSTYEEAVKAKERYRKLDLEEGADDAGPINIFKIEITKFETKKSCIDCMFYCKGTKKGYQCCSSQMHGPFIGSEETDGGCDYWMGK